MYNRVKKVFGQFCVKSLAQVEKKVNNHSKCKIIKSNMNKSAATQTHLLSDVQSNRMTTFLCTKPLDNKYYNAEIEEYIVGEDISYPIIDLPIIRDLSWNQLIKPSGYCGIHTDIQVKLYIFPFLMKPSYIQSWNPFYKPIYINSIGISIDYGKRMGIGGRVCIGEELDLEDIFKSYLSSRHFTYGKSPRKMRFLFDSRMITDISIQHNIIANYFPTFEVTTELINK